MNPGLSCSIFITLFILVFQTPGFAQFIKLGIKGGVSLSNENCFENGKIIKSPYFQKCLLSFNGGITINFLLKENWELHSEILFEDKGGKFRSTFIDIAQDSSLKENHIKHRMFYLQFPQTVRYFITLDNKGKNKIYFELGLFFAYYLMTKDVLYEKTFQGNVENRSVEYSDMTQIDGAAQYGITRLSWGITGGGGFTRKIWYGVADVNIKVDHALTPVYQNPMFNRKFYQYVIALTFGYSLPVLQKYYH